MKLNHASPQRLLRLHHVLERYPVSRSTWYAGVASGLFPRPVRLGVRAVAWKESDIEGLINKNAEGKQHGR